MTLGATVSIAEVTMTLKSFWLMKIENAFHGHNSWKLMATMG